MKKEKFNCEKARDISIVNTLEKLGHIPKKITNKEAWFLSPYRSETQASFKVDLRINRWYDHGIGKGGNIIDLIVHLKSFSVHEALQFLNGNIMSFSFHKQPIKNDISPKQSYQILNKKTLNHPALIQYLKTRKIDIDIAKEFCSEINYEINNKINFAIAFENNLKGFEIRNKYFKGCLGNKAISLIKNNSKSISVFEGFIDLLSYLTLDNMPKRKEDFLILNSISNTKKAINILTNYVEIFCFLDNDDSGQKGTVEIKNKLDGVVDCSFTFSPFKDINEYLIYNQNEQVTK